MEREERPEVKVTDKRRFVEGAQDALQEEVERGPEVADAPEGDPPSGGDELAEARRQAAEYLDHLQRLQAEFDNYRKRVAKEQTRMIEGASEAVIVRLLEVLDDFELALVAAEQKPDLEKFLQGVEMVYAKLADLLRAQGLERIEARGKPFDPELHEALFQAGEDDGEPFVADVLRTGYTLKGRVLRPAGVKVERR